MCGMSKRVLVIDDDTGVRSMLRRALILDGFEVDTATDGFEGLRLAMEGHHDVIVVDYQMPGLDGLGVLRALHTQGFDAPTVLLTGDDDPTLVAEAKLAGAAFFTRKPVSLAALSAILEALINRTNQDQG